ncbi:MAG: M48 family metallopeptidase [Oligoflexales bacterium]|nr:M48 family metallopeptidase [Oligoflexales bacterium]
MSLLTLFVVLLIGKYACERCLALMNKSYYENPNNQEKVRKALKLDEEKFKKTLVYTQDKFRFGSISGLASLVAFLVFLIFGGFGWLEAKAISASEAMGFGSIVSGLLFLGSMGLLSSLFSMPFDYYFTFCLEERHGFNRQKPGGFFVDRLKGLVLAVVLGGVLLSGILWVMEATGTYWWLWAWLVFSLFQLLTLWLYPSLLAPLFNKFTPVEEGELKKEIYSLAEKVNFKASGLFTMDASTRSTHGNAYFTGVFDEKRIVLFDTLVQSMNTKEIVAVLAHELGHFKLNHVRWMLIRGIVMMGLLFYLLGLCLPLEGFYQAFHLSGVSNYGALFVFSQWFSLVGFLISPLSSWISRKNEFAADAFGLEHTESPDHLPTALLKLSESNHSMPLVHPWYSTFYHSHPPLLERLNALNYTKT